MKQTANRQIEGTSMNTNLLSAYYEAGNVLDFRDVLERVTDIFPALRERPF